MKPGEETGRTGADSGDTEEDVICEFNGQLSDGIFENYNYGKIEEVSLNEIEDWLDALEEKISERDDI